MTKHNTAELQGAELDLGVALAEGFPDAALQGEDDEGLPVCMLGHPSRGDFFSPSTDWIAGGLIIERERILVAPRQQVWRALAGTWDVDGPTPLIAAMRAYVASKFGETVELA